MRQDRLLPVSAHSVLRQGCMPYELIPNMPEHRLAPLIQAFAEALTNAAEFNGMFARQKCGNR